MNKKIKILHLEDSQKDSELIHSIIKSGEIEFDYFFIDNEKGYVNILEKEDIDLILSDFSLPDYNGNDALRVAREKYSHIPFIFVSGAMGEDAAITSMLNGATDYVLKNNLARLVPAIKRSLLQSENNLMRKQAEKALKESREMLHKAQKLAHFGVWDWEADLDVVTWTEELYQIAGLDPKHPPPTYAEHATLYSPQSWHLLKTAVENAMKTGEHYELELELIRSDGIIRNVIAFGGAKLDGRGKATGLYGTVQDITEKKKADEALLESESRYKDLFEQTRDIIFLLSPQALLLSLNQAFGNITGWQVQEWIGKPVFDLLHPEDIPLAAKRFSNVLKGIFSQPIELRLRNKSGDYIPCEVLASPSMKNGMNNGLQGICRDITERKQAEQELININQKLLFQIEEKEKQAEELVIARKKAEESDNLKSAFLHNLSHEIRTPMNQILGFASFLRDPDITEKQRDNYITIINSQSYQLLHIITNIVEISEITTGHVDLKLSIFNLSEMMDELFTSFKPKAEYRNLQLRLNKKIADADAMIRGDQVKLKNVFDHLIENAIKYTDTGSVEIEYSRSGDNLVVAVKDTGIGIAEIEQKFIFEQFRRIETNMLKNYGGMGLGLAIATAYIRMMNGTIRVESEPGKGSTFFVEIPNMSLVRVSESVVNRSKSRLHPFPDWQDKTLLVAEDEESNADYLTVALRATHVHLLFASNGLEAVEQCKTHPEITLVLMDIKMPRMDGLEATKIIKSLRSDLPVIATTAYAGTDEREFILQSGCDDYLPKPIKQEDLVAKIQKYI